jgi:ABC-type bacteriocin/lantibiotic exporter with double-glycine peptidase domain
VIRFHQDGCYIEDPYSSGHFVLQRVASYSDEVSSFSRYFKCFFHPHLSWQCVLQADVVGKPEEAEPLPAAWPQHGHVQFVEVRLRYHQSAPYALAGLSLDIPPGHKIGICGRTGASLPEVHFAAPFARSLPFLP